MKDEKIGREKGKCSLLGEFVIEYVLCHGKPIKYLLFIKPKYQEVDSIEFCTSC